jgi:hypothetical protein
MSWMIWHDPGVRSRFVGILAIPVVLAVACGGGGHSAASSNTTPTSTRPSTAVSTTPARTGPLSTGPGVQPGEKPPVLNEDAKQHTPAGALLFANYYIRALDWSFATNDSYLLKAISSPTCPACNRYITALDGLGEGEHLTGSRIGIVSDRLITGSFKVKSDAVVKFVLNDQAAVIVKPSSAPSTVAPAARHDVSLVFVSWIAGAWKVVEEGAPS